MAIAFLEVVDNPRQDVPLLSVLTCPAWGFSGDDLAHLRARCPEGTCTSAWNRGAGGRGKMPPLSGPPERPAGRAADLPGHQLLWQIYEAADLLAIYGAMEGGAGPAGQPAAAPRLRPAL